MKTITISVEGLKLNAELNNSETAQQIYAALPLEGSVNLWGDEIYFDIPLSIELDEDARETVDIGDLGYWPAGPAFCIFYGRTPVSTDGLPRAYSPVNVFGRISGDATQFTAVSNGSKILVDIQD